MSTYWDSSALLNAVVSRAVADKIMPSDVTRAHAFCEVFSHLTGRGIPTKSGPVKLSNADAAQLIKHLAKKFTLRELTGEETLSALEDSTKLGVQGGRVHDLMHARSAVLAGVDKIFTRNIADFVGLPGAIPLERP